MIKNLSIVHASKLIIPAFRNILFFVLILLLEAAPGHSLERPDKVFKIFQFPANMIPRIDGDPLDWSIVPEDYAVSLDELRDTVNANPADKSNFDVTVKVGWVKGMNKLYVLYEAYDDYWQFEEPGLECDVFELVVDADLSGGPLIPQLRKDMKMEGWSAYMFHGVHAQNYHIFTPHEGKEWAMVWGCQPWIAELPWANSEYSYNFKHGESGRLSLEFWITPFDYAPYEGPERAVISKLVEDENIGLSWTILERDKHDDPKKSFAFWSLSHTTTMYGNASELVNFKLMPLEKQFRKDIEADWSFKTIDNDRGIVAFHDQSYGNITSWNWDFGDGGSSTERNPVHHYTGPAVGNPAGNYQYQYVVVLTVDGPDGSARMSRVWNVAVK